MENLQGIHIEVFYGKELQKITGSASEQMMLSSGVTFIYLLQCIFMSYPEIEEKYPPGVLGILINGTPPTGNMALFEGDRVELLTH
jgi:predicted ABC-type sugar transport system permease subunit